MKWKKIKADRQKTFFESSSLRPKDKKKNLKLGALFFFCSFQYHLLQKSGFNWNSEKSEIFFTV